MASSQQPVPFPECQELRDERAPGRMRALRAFIAVSVFGWLAFAVLVAASAPDPLPAEADLAQALDDAQATAAAVAHWQADDRIVRVSQDTSAP